MRGTSVIPITMLRMFLREHPDPEVTTSEQKEEFLYLASNSIGPWLDEMLTPLRPKYDLVRRATDPDNLRMDDWCRGINPDSISGGVFAWAGFPRKNKRGSLGTVFGANVGLSKSSRIVIGFSMDSEYVFKEHFNDDRLIPWCHDKIPKIGRRLDERLRTEEMRESR